MDFTSNPTIVKAARVASFKGARNARSKAPGTLSLFRSLLRGRTLLPCLEPVPFDETLGKVPGTIQSVARRNLAAIPGAEYTDERVALEIGEDGRPQPFCGEFMSTTVEAVIDQNGAVHLLEHVPLSGPRRALVIILDEEPASLPHETALLSEPALAEDWNRPEEDAAWSYLQSGK